jgi:nucleoid-associated protein YgaU
MGLLDKIFDNDKNDDKKANTRPTTPAPAPRAEAPRADFSNVQGASATTAPADRATPASARTYTVKSGDSLSKIAQRELGDASKWNAIFDANRDKISDPDLIHPGQVLTMPTA